MDSSRDTRGDGEVFNRYLRRPNRRRLERVVRRFHARVWRTALRLTGHEEDAADLEQDLFLSLLLEPPRAGTVRSPAGYLAFRVLTLARRRERSGRRRRQRENRAARELLERSPSPELDVEAVRQAIGELPDPLRTTIELRYMAQFRNREIAELIGVSERSVEEYLYRGRESLRARLRGVSLAAIAVATTAQADGSMEGERAALDSALRVVQLGRALAPLSTTVAITGGIAMKKILAAAAVVLLLAGLVTWRVLTPPAGEPVETPARPGVSSAPTPAEAHREEIVVPEKPGEEPVEAVAVEERGPPPVEYRSRVAGRVIDELGRAVPGARISACVSPLQIFAGREPELVGETESDEEGAFVLESVRVDGRVFLSVSAEKAGFATAQSVAHASPRSTEVDGVLLVLESGAEAIRGRIVDERGVPIPGARVWPCAFTTAFGLRQFGMLASGGDGSVKSSEDGRFRIEGLRSSTPVDLTVTHPDYRRAQIRYLVPGGPELEIELASGFLFAGRVVDVSANPVRGARIELREDAPERFGGGVHHEETRGGEDGAFALRAVPAGVYFLSVDPPPEYLPVPEDRIEIDGPVEDFVITVETGPRVEGFARVEGSGEALAGVRLTVLSAGKTRSVETDSSGAFRCAVEPGPVVVMPRGDPRGLHDPLEGFELDVGVDESDALTGEVWFARREVTSPPTSPPAVSGRVVDPSGKPVVALVALSDVVDGSGFNGQQSSTQSDIDGAFAFASLRWRPARLIAANAPRRLLGQLVIREESDSRGILLTLSPYPAPRVEGIVRREDGTPVPLAGVILSRSGSELDGAAFCTRAGDDGRFTLEGLFPDTYYGFTPVVRTRQGRTVRKRTGRGASTHIELVLPGANATLAGTVTDRRGFALPDVRVRFEYNEDNDVREEVAVTDAGGRFDSKVFPGRYFVRVDERGFGFWSDVVEAPAELAIVLTRTRPLNFVAVEAGGLPIEWLSVSGKVEGGRNSLSSPDGRYEVEIQENETEVTIENWQFQPRKVELHWPPRGALDLGTLEFTRRDR